MDTSKKYIQMCEKAKEIQKLSPVTVIGIGRIGEVDNKYHGSFFAFPRNGYYGIEILHYDNDEEKGMVGGYGMDLSGIIWLPRQDQLQEMLPELTIWNKVYLLYTHAKEKPILDSMEKLWLSIVMYMQYSKVWNGQDWASSTQ